MAGAADAVSTEGAEGDAKRRRTSAEDDAPDHAETCAMPSGTAAILAMAGLDSSDGESSTETHEADISVEGKALKGKARHVSSDSESASDSDSTSSSSSSSSSSEPPPRPSEKLADLVVSDESDEARKRRQLLILRGAYLRRDELVKMLRTLPEEVAEKAILHSFVRLAVRGGAGVLAEVTGVESSPACSIATAFQLYCTRGSSRKLFKVSDVSNQDVTQREFDQWLKFIERAGLDVNEQLEMMLKKADHLRQARSFSYSEEDVSRILSTKPSIIFDAQKDATYRSLVQCTLSQMEIGGIKENGIEELDQQYKEALDKLHSVEQRSNEAQELWFKKRGDLFSQKEINRKNLLRQEARDKHALDFVYGNEAGGKGDLNPFQRRACRPVSYWDTKLASVAGLDGAQAEAVKTPTEHIQEKDAVAAETPPKVAVAPLSKIDHLLRAHKQANLLAKFVSVAVA